MTHQILLYYKYTKISDPEQLMEDQRALCQKLDLKGRIIVATEGINGTVEGTIENTEKYIQEMSKDERFNDIHWKKSEGTGDSFPRLSVKVRKEIVSLHLENNEDIDPNEITGNRLKPEELKKWYEENKDFVIVDMRNDYELEIGKFDRTVFPGMKNFRDLRKQVQAIKDLKDKTVVTVCTGGVRCEKASGLLKKEGFKDVHQLDGGMVSFMEKYPNSEFKGSLYVFDNRITMHFDDPDKHIVIGKCRLCKKSCERYVNCINNGCHLHFVCCEDCTEPDGRSYCSSKCKQAFRIKEASDFIKSLWKKVVVKKKKRRVFNNK